MCDVTHCLTAVENVFASILSVNSSEPLSNLDNLYRYSVTVNTFTSILSVNSHLS